MSLDDVQSYSKWLSEQLEELHISQRELGEAVGKTQRTISRYVNGENLPDEKTASAITDYIARMSEHEGYRHIPAKEFAELLRNLMKEFGITQAKLAREIHKHQKDISGCINGELKLSTIEQERMLMFFHGYAKPNGEYLTAHIGTGVMLEELLYPEEERFMPPVALEFGEQLPPRSGAYFVMSLPIKVQELIINHWSVFCDNLLELEGVSLTDFRRLKSCIVLFRELRSEQQWLVEERLSEYMKPEFPQTEEEWVLFQLITDYRDVFQANLPRLMKPEAAEEYHEKFRNTIESLMNLYPVDDDKFVEELKFRLSLSRYEWFILMMMDNFSHTGHSLRDLYKYMMEFLF